MKRISLTLASLLVLCATMNARADTYNPVPPDDAQYKQCLADAAKDYEGGNDKSPVKGQTKAAAYCSCLWNETSEGFSGRLMKFAESEKGAKINRICEKHANWRD
ncbi:MAG: hypothetical protein H7Z39_02485 [Burkholderiaceae bacterium]|nr:hypothetical protein [Burkholderiaceae bacterium]